MKAVVRHTYGAPDVMAEVELDKPVPGPAEVLIRVHATALNASDLEMLTGKPLYGRAWGFFTPKVKVLGSDVAGTVDALGADVTRFAPGDAVYGDIFVSWGGLAEWVCAPQSMLRLKPESLSFEEAAAIPQSATIALQGVRDVQPGQKVLVNGGGGGAGTFAIQIATALGGEVTAVDNAEKLELMRSLGAERVVDYASEDVTAGDERYDLILDLVGGHTVFDFRRALAPDGRYFLVGGSVRLVFGVLLIGGILSLLTRKKIGLLYLKQNEGMDAIEQYVDSGAVTPFIDKRYHLSEAPDAFRRLAEGRAKGKLVIVAEADKTE